MPPELKKPITCIEQMTCENCVFSSTRKEFGDPKSDRSYAACHNGENEYFLDEITGQGNYCSQGQWLTLEDWVNQDNQNTKLLFLGSYDEIYFRFAERLMMSNTRNKITGCDDKVKLVEQEE